MRQPIRVVSALRVIGPQFLLFFFYFIIPFCRDYIHKYITSMSCLTSLHNKHMTVLLSNGKWFTT